MIPYGTKKIALRTIATVTTSRAPRNEVRSIGGMGAASRQAATTTIEVNGYHATCSEVLRRVSTVVVTLRATASVRISHQSVMDTSERA